MLKANSYLRYFVVCPLSVESLPIASFLRSDIAIGGA